MLGCGGLVQVRAQRRASDASLRLAILADRKLEAYATCCSCDASLARFGSWDPYAVISRWTDAREFRRNDFRRAARGSHTFGRVSERELRYGQLTRWADRIAILRFSLALLRDVQRIVSHTSLNPLCRYQTMTRRLVFPCLVFLMISGGIATAQPPGGGRGPGGGFGGRGGGPGQGGPGGGSPVEMLNQMFDTMDANQDGQLSRSEVASAINGRNGEPPRGGMQRGRSGPPQGQGDAPGFGRGLDRGGRPGGENGPMQPGQGGPGQGGPGQGGPGGPPPRPGQVLPDFVVEELGLNDRQQRQLTVLQGEVDKRLAAMLTDEQKQQLENHHQHGHHGQGGPQHGDDAGLHGNDRPQRPE